MHRFDAPVDENCQMGNLLDEAVTGVDNRLKQGLVDSCYSVPARRSGVWASGILCGICNSITPRLRYFLGVWTCLGGVPETRIIGANAFLEQTSLA